MTRRRVGAGLALVAVVAVVLVVVLSNNSASAGSSNNSALSNSPGVTTVQRRDLVETDTESGTLSYASPQTVYNNLSGTITWLPRVGQLIKPGQTLYKVSNVPVMLMNGSTPAYRALSAADTPGPDILELNRNLISLGFNPDGIVAEDTWQSATTAGVDVLQAYLGQTETGSLALGQVVFLPGPQLVSTLNETVGADPGGPTSAASLTDTTAPPARPEFVDLKTGTTPTAATTTPTPTRTTPGPAQQPGGRRPPAACPKPRGSRKPRQKCSSASALQALIALLRAEIAELNAPGSARPGASHSGSPGSHSGSPAGHSGSGHPSSPSGGGSPGAGGTGSSPSGGGGGGGGGAAVLRTTSTQLVVTVDLDASKQSEARVGEKVTVEMPAGNVVGGTISAVSSVATSSSGSGGGGSGGGSGGSSSSIPVTITLTHTPKGRGLDQAAVSVNFAQAQAKNVLSVPVTALLAVPGGGYSVQEAAAPHKLLRVTTGLFAAGYVQVSGPGITDGLQVTNSEG
jgi:hypothetical protein